MKEIKNWPTDQESRKAYINWIDKSPVSAEFPEAVWNAAIKWFKSKLESKPETIQEFNRRIQRHLESLNDPKLESKEPAEGESQPSFSREDMEGFGIFLDDSSYVSDNNKWFKIVSDYNAPTDYVEVKFDDIFTEYLNSKAGKEVDWEKQFNEAKEVIKGMEKKCDREVSMAVHRRDEEKQYLIDTLKDILVSCDSLEKLKWRVRETLKHFKTE